VQEISGWHISVQEGRVGRVEQMPSLLPAVVIRGNGRSNTFFGVKTIL
jgi:hypothetical protein